jgi:hypothetical protein
METKYAIFIVSTPLLIPFLYYSTSLSDACALPPDPQWGKTGNCYFPVSSDHDIMTCCWEEPDLYNPGETVTWCQTCTTTEGTQVCDEAVIKPASPTSPQAGTHNPPQGSVLEDKPTKLPKTFGNLEGRVLKVPEKSNTLPQNDSTTNTFNNSLK